MSGIGNYALPVLLFIICLIGLIRLKSSVFDVFLAGAKSGLKTVVSILPSLIGLITTVQIFRASGATDLICKAVAPVADLIHLPPEILPLIILRPISGSGSVAILSDILSRFGADSHIGRLSSTICATGDTMLYTITVYYGAIGVKKTRYTLIVAMLADFFALIISNITVSIML